jgi:3-oxoadipate enol-lactonase
MNSEKEKRYLIGEEDLPIVLLHGTIGKSEDWSRVVEALSNFRMVIRPN